MPIQAATTGQLDAAQRIAIAKARFTAEHSAPVFNLVEHMTLSDGDKSITVPKVGQMTATGLTDGIDMTDSEDIGMTTTSLTTAEVGLKVILTDKLVRQENEDVMKMVGRQMGDAVARKKDTDLIALFTAFNGGTTLGVAGATLSLQNLSACIAFAKANKFPSPVVIVQHPNAIFDVALTSAAIPSANNPMPRGFSEDLLRDFYKFVVNQVAVFEDGNITADGSGDGIGAIFSNQAAVYVESKGFGTERQRDASLRATELVVVLDYGVFELDDGYGAPMTYDIANPSTTA